MLQVAGKHVIGRRSFGLLDLSLISYIADFSQIEPLAVGLNAVANVAKLRPTSNVVIFGAGPVGLLYAALVFVP